MVITFKMFIIKPIYFYFPGRSVLLYLGDMIPKLKTRQTGASAAQSTGQQQTSSGGGGGKKKNKRK